MEVNKLWQSNDINKYHIISLDKETNEWKFFREIVGHTVFWRDEPPRYGMTKTKAIEVLNIVKSLTKENIKPEPTIPTESETPTEGEGGTETPTNPTENEGTTTPTDNTSGETSGDTPTEPSENNNGSPTNTGTVTSTGENNNGETPSEGNTEPNNGNETNTDPVAPVEPETPTEPQYKIITISSVTYNSTEVAIFDDVDYNKLKSTLTYIDSTYPNTVVHVVTKSDTGKSIFYFYLDEELTWFLELKTNIDYALVSNVTTLNDIKELL